MFKIQVSIFNMECMLVTYKLIFYNSISTVLHSNVGHGFGLTDSIFILLTIVNKQPRFRVKRGVISY